MQRHTLSKDTAIVQGRDGWFIINRNDLFVGRAIETYGEYGGLELLTLQSLIDDGHRVIEVGANIGSHTVGLAKKVGRRGKIYAYEPQSGLYAMLQGQAAINGLPQITALNIGVGAKEGVFWHTVQNYESEGNFGAVSLSSARTENAEPVRVMPLDMLHNPQEPIRLIKIDVEGMEADVVIGGRNLINAQRPILYIENDRPEKSRPLLEVLFSLGYRGWWHLPPLFNPQNYFGVTHNAYGDARSINMLCLHRDISFPGAANLREVRLEDPHPASSW